MYNKPKHLTERSVEATDTNRMKRAAEWFYNTIFQEESIKPRAPKPAEKLPSLLRAARSLESSVPGQWQSREKIFLKQAKLLSAFEDDCPYPGNVVRYFPTYQALTDRELRGYFTWRAKLRRGEIEKTSLTFAFLYTYELINLVGVAGPMEGYLKLKRFGEDYGALDGSITPYLNRWLTDYVVYYNLDPDLLADSPRVCFDRSITILDNICHQTDEKAIWAVKQLAPKWLERSKFYAQYQSDCDRVILGVLRRMHTHYAKRCKKSFVEQYFGTLSQVQVQLFDSAVFCDPLKVRNVEYPVDERCVYRCTNSLWTVTRHSAPVKPSGKLNDLLKTIDSVMRQEYGYKHPVKAETETKWVLKLIEEEVRALLEEKQAAQAKKITIDLSRLAKIRQDAAITQEKLTVEEEPEEEEKVITPGPEPEAPPPLSPDCPLDAAEYRLMQCLLYGRDTGWIHREGYMLSVLLDGINDKLYDTFLDTVVDDTPAVIEDYIEELKEMIAP